MFGLSLSLSLGAGGRVRWSPASLGASLLGFWDAERADLITSSGGAVSSWKDTVAGYDAVQAVSASKPTYSATSFNSRPGVSLDGVDDELSYAGLGVLPTGATACEIWALVDQLAADGDAATGYIFSYGSTGLNDQRRIARNQVSGQSRALGTIGTGGAAISPAGPAAAFNGKHVLRLVVSATAGQTDVDGSAGTPSAGVPATASTGRTRIGATANPSASNFAKVIISGIIVTAPLTADQATQLYTYLNARKA